MNYFWNYLPTFGDIASIIGAIISGYVLWDLRRLERRYFLKARIPEIFQELDGITDEISEDLKNYQTNRREVETNFSRCESIIRDLCRKLYGEPKKQANKLLDTISHRVKPLSKDKAYELHDQIMAFKESLKNYEKDMRWSQ